MHLVLTVATMALTPFGATSLLYVHQTDSHNILFVAGITLDHHFGWLKHTVGDLK